MKLIDLLLRLYPEEFRERFGRDMREFHQDRVREKRPRWPRILADHLRSAVAEHVRSIGPDVRFALRGIARRPAFAAVVVLTLALGVGANAAIFSVVNGILLRPLPYPDAERVVSFLHAPPQWLVSAPQYAQYRSTLRTLESLAAYVTDEGNLSEGDDPERIPIAAVTPNFFATLGVAPALGRTFAAGEDEVRPARVAILSHDLWQRRFGGDPGILGRAITFNGIDRTVIGVMPDRFEYPVEGTQLWLPICSQRTCASLATLMPDSLDGWVSHYLWLVGRLRPGAGIEQVRAEAGAVARRIVLDHPEIFGPTSSLAPDIQSVHERLIGPTRPYLIALLGAVGFVLLIACVNIANLLLARGESRRREMALRTALGASGRRLAAQLLTESTVLAVLGGMAGFALAWAGTRMILAAAPASLPRLDEVRVDWMVALFALGISLIAGFLFAIVPSVRAVREAPVDSLRAAAKGAGAGQHGGSGRLRRSLVMAEVAIAMVLLSGAGMLVRSLLHLHGRDMGFDARSVLTAQVSPTNNAYDEARAVAFYDRLLERVREIPGVRVAGASRWLPVVETGGLWNIAVEGKQYAPGQGVAAVPMEVTPGYFAAMGMPILRGRDFTAHDRVDAPLVAIVSRGFAEKVWPGEESLGRRFRLGGPGTQWLTVVGVVSDIRARGFIDTPEPTMYFPHAQTAAGSYFVPRSMSLVVRTTTEPAAIADHVRRAVHALDRAIPVSKIRTLEEVVATSTAERRFSTSLIAGFAMLALLLAGIGIYGVTSYAVSERTFEFGVRMALGAKARNVLALVMSEGAGMALAGIVLGVAGSAALARAIRSMLVGVPAVDVVTMLGVAALLGGVAVAASLVPARRATAVNPTEALRGGS